jgi:signal peptidase II
MSTKGKGTRYDFSSLIVSLTVILCDLLTKSLVVMYLSPPKSKSVLILGQYLQLFYVINSAAAFSLLKNQSVLIVCICLALMAVGYVYYRFSNSGSWRYKVALGLIIGGALSNIIDRIRNGGYVIDFLFFRIPQIKFSFAVFNIADACIVLGAGVLFFLILLTKNASSVPTKGDVVQLVDKESTTSA